MPACGVRSCKRQGLAPPSAIFGVNHADLRSLVVLVAPNVRQLGAALEQCPVSIPRDRPRAQHAMGHFSTHALGAVVERDHRQFRKFKEPIRAPQRGLRGEGEEEGTRLQGYNLTLYINFTWTTTNSFIARKAESEISRRFATLGSIQIRAIILF